MKTRLRAIVTIGVLLSSPAIARADVVLEWNAITVATLIGQGQNPFSQARFAAITQLAVFEAVNAITRDYEPYVGILAPAGASAEAAAVAAAYRVLKNYFPLAPNLETYRDASLAAIPDGNAKTYGIETGEKAAKALIDLRANDGSSPATNFTPGPPDPGVWQTTPSCPPAGGILYQWQNVTPFGIPGVAQFRPGPPPTLTKSRYTKDYNEVKKFGSLTSADRKQDRTDVARFYAASSPTLVFNSAARQVATAEHRSLSRNARDLALLNMSTSDSLVVSFSTKYLYNFWRPETAIRAGDTDDNPRTKPDINFAPLILTPCFPSYPSNHASGSTGSAEVLRRLYGADGHDITMSNPAVPGITFHYTTFRQITDDIDDARVFGGIHFRFDQEGGARLGRDVAAWVVKHNLRRAKHSWLAQEDEVED
jgi:hypothetical protein